MRTPTPRTLDLLLATGGVTLGVVDVLTRDDLAGAPSLNVLAAVAVGLIFYARRRSPVAGSVAFLAVACAMAVWLEPPDELIVPFFALILMPYSLGAHSQGRPMLVGLLSILAAPPLVEALRGPVELGDLTFLPILCMASWFAGRSVRSRTELAAELHEATVREQEAQEAEALRAIAEERRRIAREMHDIVAHSVSVMVVQAGGARRILPKDPDRAAQAAREIETIGRGALAEMRRMLGVLQGRAEERAPQPGLAGLERLVERARAAGQPVTLRVEGESRPLPAGLDLAAYRVVQEALTNAIKHANGADTQVLVRWGPEDVELAVSDAGGGVAAAVNGGGHGLIGMKERVRLYGGELSSGLRPGGGFEVRATIPLEG